MIYVESTAMKALHHAICENNYYCADEYLIVIQNVTKNYCVDFSHTTEGDWADELFEQACSSVVDYAYSRQGDEYFAIFAQSHEDCTIEIIKEFNLCINSKKINGVTL